VDVIYLNTSPKNPSPGDARKKTALGGVLKIYHRVPPRANLNIKISIKLSV